MIMLKHNQHHEITFYLCSSGCHNSCTAAKQNLVKYVNVNCPTKPNTDLHNGDYKL